MKRSAYCYAFVLLLSCFLYYLSSRELLESKELWENRGLGNEGMSRVNAFLHYQIYIGVFFVAIVQVSLCFGFSSWHFGCKLIAVSSLPLLFYFGAVWSTTMVKESLGSVSETRSGSGSAFHGDGQNA